MQGEGARRTERNADILFALAMSRAMVQATLPDASPRDQALAVLPFSIQDLDGFDSLADTFATGDLTALAQRVDPALSDAGAAELISSIAFLMGQKIPADGDLGKTFNTAYQAALP